MAAKHLIFISAKKEFAKNDDYIKTKLLKRWSANIYAHWTEEEAQDLDANLVIFFGEDLLWKRFPEKTFAKFFKDQDGQMIYSIENYRKYDKLEKKEINEKIKQIRTHINTFLSRFAVIRVMDRGYFYRDIDFRKIKKPNPYKADHKFVEDPEGEFMSFDGKKLKQVPREYRTFDTTYEDHLRSKDLFYINAYPNVAHTKLLHYCTFDIETNLSLDIENTPEPIISIAAYSNIHDKTMVWILKKRPDQIYDETEFKENKIFEFDNEEEMLTHFFNSMSKLEVDLLGGWNTDFFDIPYLLHRSKKLGVDFSHYLSNLYESIGKDGERAYSCDEVILWDYLRYAKWIIVDNKPISWSLDAVSQHLFNEKKIEHEGIEVLWDKDDLSTLLRYNIKDVYLTEKIAQMQKIIEFPILYQKIAPQTYENVYFNSRFLEMLIHQRFKQFKFPTKKKQKEASKYEGALVLTTQPGLFENVSVYDFSSLYPSIMISLNLSKDTIVEDLKDFDAKKDIKIDKVLFTTSKRGIIPQLSQLLVEERNKLKKRKMQFDGNSQQFKIANDMEMCFKGTSNALYGVLGYRGFILYDKRVASSVTYVAREVLRFIRDKAESLGYTILTGDTDSIFIKIQAETFEETVRKSKELQDIFNQSLPEFLRKFTKSEDVVKSHIMQIVFEKSFSKLLLSPAKKKQVGFLKFFKGKILDKEELYVKGFESIKEDTATYFKKVLTQLYENILDNYGNIEKLREFVSYIKADLRKQSPIDLVVRKKMSKRMEDYDVLPIHIRALKNSGVELKRGETVNMLYVKDDREVIHYDPALDLKYEIDYKRYFEDFLVKKINLIDESIYYQLFKAKTQLVDLSKMNIHNRITKKRMKTGKLV
jgi:DNA polymerase elongation subunit (family B)